MTIVKQKPKYRTPGDAFIEGAPDSPKTVVESRSVEERTEHSDLESESVTAIRGTSHSLVDGPQPSDQPMGYRKGNKRQITLTITDKLYGQVTALAEKLGQSRASVINSAIYQAVNKGVLND